MKKWYIFFLLLLSFKAIAINTDTTKHKGFNLKPSGGLEGFFRMNYNKLNFDNLNASLTGSTFIAPSTPTLSVGGGGVLVIGHLILGGEGQTLVTQSTQYNLKINGTAYSQKNTYGGGYGLFNIGVSIISRTHLLIYPQIGIGEGHIYALTNITPTDNSFNATLTNPGLYQKTVNRSFMLNPKLCIDFLLANSYVLGINVGYNYMTNTQWSINDTRVSDGPKSNINGVYGGVTIGIGGVYKN